MKSYVMLLDASVPPKISTNI